MRTYQTTFDVFRKRLWEPLQNLGEVDIFIHTWDSLYHPNSNSFSFYANHADANKPLDADDLIKIYNPKAMIVENYNELKATFSIDCGDGHVYSNNYLPMYYKIHACDKLRQKSNFIYDWVIKWRGDAFLTQKLELEKYSSNLFNTNDPDESDGRCRDVFWLTSPEIMTKVTKIWEDMKPLLTTNHTDNSELLLYNYIKSKGIQVGRIDGLTHCLRPNNVGPVIQ